jgi:hypothetical protein
MFAKGPMPGATPKDEALLLLPAGTTCRRMSGGGITGYIVELADGTQIASAGNAGQAWRAACGWASRHPLLAKKA